MGASPIHAKYLQQEKIKHFTETENKTWSILYKNLDSIRDQMAWSNFSKGIDLLEFNALGIPDLEKTNQRLYKQTGWRGIPVNGLEDGYSFYPSLARKEFPIGNFIRDIDSLGYTPAPDIFHDLYGHIPFFMDQPYGDFCQRYGALVSKYLDQPDKLKMFERFFWFTIEFGLVKTNEGTRIFGAGILSSFNESHYSLSHKPEVAPFDIKTIIHQDYSIDHIQPRLFLLNSPDQLYESLTELEQLISTSTQ